METKFKSESFTVVSESELTSVEGGSIAGNALFVGGLIGVMAAPGILMGSAGFAILGGVAGALAALWSWLD